MSDRWTERLSEYLDDERPQGTGGRWKRISRHCVACAAMLTDLRRVEIGPGTSRTGRRGTTCGPGSLGRSVLHRFALFRFAGNGASRCLSSRRPRWR